MTCLCERIAGEDLVLSPTCLGHLWVFENLSSQDLQGLTDAALRRRFQRGDTIFQQGAAAQEMFLIKGGTVKLSKITESGEEITLDIRKSGDFIGENTLNEDLEYPVNAVCLEETLTCGFTKTGFERLVLDRPVIGLQVIKNLSKRIDWLTSRIGSMAMTNLESRLYRVLVNVAREHGVKTAQGLTIQFPLTHEDLSFLVGAHRVSITRAMKVLKESGRIAQEGRMLIVSDQAVA